MSQICPTCLSRHPAEYARCPDDGERLIALEVGDGRLGTVVADRYVIIGILGQGGMGMVYRAWQRAMGRYVAIKTLHAIQGGPMRDALEKRFSREARATAALSSPHTVTVFDFGALDDGSLFLVMELLEGVALSALVEAQGPLPPSMVRTIGMQICRSLSEAHARGIVHRDMKPSNVLIGHASTGEVHAKVLDFGIAKVLDEDTTDLTGTGATVGSISYMSPEQIDGRAVGPPADIYSLGVTLFDVLTDSLPFDAPTRLALMFKHLSEAPPSVMTRLGYTAEAQAFDAILQRCMAKTPPDRFASVDELYQALAELSVSDVAAPRTTAKPLGAELTSGYEDTVSDANMAELDRDTRPGGTVGPAGAPKSSTTRSEKAAGPAIAKVTPARTQPKLWMFPAVLSLGLLGYLAADALFGGGDPEGSDPTPEVATLAMTQDTVASDTIDAPARDDVLQTSMVAAAALDADTISPALPVDTTEIAARDTWEAVGVVDTAPARAPPTRRPPAMKAPTVKVVSSAGLVDTSAGERVVGAHVSACAKRHRPAEALSLAVTSGGVKANPSAPALVACIKGRLARQGMGDTQGAVAFVKLTVKP